MKKCWVIALTLLLSACGFHLRGHAPLPSKLHRMQLISASPYDAFSKTLIQSFSQNGASLSVKPIQGAYQLVIDQANSTQKTIGLSSGMQSPHYEIGFALRYHVNNGKGRVLLKEQHVQRTRMTSTTNLNMGGDAKNALEMQQLMEDVATQLILQLRSTSTLKQLNKG